MRILMDTKIKVWKEGISEQIIKVTGNPIVDIINENKNLFESGDQFLSQEIF